MKIRVLFIGIIFTILSACGKKDNSSSGGSGNLSFKVNGATVNTNAWNASWGNLHFDFLTTNITSNMHKDKRTVNININAVKPGTYNFITGVPAKNKAAGFYYPDYSKSLNNFQFISGSFEITEIDTITLTFSGKFSGTAKNSDTKEEVSITEGIVTNAKLVKFDY